MVCNELCTLPLSQAEWVSQKAQFEHHLLHRSSIECVRRWICNREPNFQLCSSSAVILLCSFISHGLGSCQGKTESFSEDYSVRVTFKLSSVHPKQLHTGSERGCSCNCRTIPLCCCFQLLHRRRQYCSLQKLLTAASVSQERPGGTKTSYMRGQKTSHQQEGEFSAFPVLFPLSCIPPSVQGTEPLSKAGLTMCNFSLASFIPGLRDILSHRACWSLSHVSSFSLSYSGEALRRMEEKRLPAESSAPLHLGHKTSARSVLILNCSHSG